MGIINELTVAVKLLEEKNAGLEREAEQLRERVRFYQRVLGYSMAGEFPPEVETACAERDALKAEVERLRGAIVDTLGRLSVLTCKCWECKQWNAIYTVLQDAISECTPAQSVAESDDTSALSGITCHDVLALSDRGSGCRTIAMPVADVDSVIAFVNSRPAIEAEIAETRNKYRGLDYMVRWVLGQLWLELDATNDTESLLKAALPQLAEARCAVKAWEDVKRQEVWIACDRRNGVIEWQAWPTNRVDMGDRFADPIAAVEAMVAKLKEKYEKA